LNSLDSEELSEWGAFFKIENERMKDKQEGKSDMPVEDKVKAALRFPGAKVK